MATLVTGATGFLGKELIPLLPGKIYALARTPPEPSGNTVPLCGDITQTNLGLETIPPDLDSVWHLAALLDLGAKHNKEVYSINAEGTMNVLKFCVEHSIPRLYFCSTAYTQGRNMYEISKRRAEESVRNFSLVHGIKSTIFKPSIIVASSRTFQTDGAKGFYQFVGMLSRTHRIMEKLRKRTEAVLRLPMFEPTFRVSGDPDATLNLVPVDWIAECMVKAIDKEGTFYLTNPNPPRLQDLADWVSEVAHINIKITPKFSPSLPEFILARKAKPFLPYLKGEDVFPSDFSNCPLVDKSFIQKSISFLL